MRHRFHIGLRLEVPLDWDPPGGRTVDPSTRSARPFSLHGPRYRTLDVYGHPYYRLRRVA